MIWFRRPWKVEPIYIYSCSPSNPSLLGADRARITSQSTHVSGTSDPENALLLCIVDLRKLTGRAPRALLQRRCNAVGQLQPSHAYSHTRIHKASNASNPNQDRSQPLLSLAQPMREVGGNARWSLILIQDHGVGVRASTLARATKGGK